MMMLLLRRSIAGPILKPFRQGLTPEKISRSIALGITLGVTPLLGSTSLPCSAAAVLLRLNQPLVQTVNYLVYPLQLALLIPFIRVGRWMFGAQPMGISLAHIFDLLPADVWSAITAPWTATMHALAAWLVLDSAAFLVIYALPTPVLRRPGGSLRAESR